jgi:hypothetical protein
MRSIPGIQQWGKLKLALPQSGSPGVPATRRVVRASSGMSVCKSLIFYLVAVHPDKLLGHLALCWYIARTLQLTYTKYFNLSLRLSILIQNDLKLFRLEG